jgi:hypothetical protein
MAQSASQDVRAGDPGGKSKADGIDTAWMWDNLCKADELLDECEALAEGMSAGSSAAALDPGAGSTT